MYKNTTHDYYMAIHDDTAQDAQVMTSATGTNWPLVESSLVTVDTSTENEPDMGVWNLITYDNQTGFFYADASPYITLGYWTAAVYNHSLASWQTIDTGIPSRGYYNLDGWDRAGIGFSMIYYDNEYQVVCGVPEGTNKHGIRLAWYSGTPWDDWSFNSFLETYTSSYAGAVTFSLSPSLEILSGTLVLVYKDFGSDLHYRTYDGVGWVDGGDIEADIGLGCSIAKDEINNQLVLVYVNNTGELVFRVMEAVGSGWSDPHLVFDPGSNAVQYPKVSYIDARAVITLGYNVRANRNVYTISAPDYTQPAVGQYNRIQFEDTPPSSTNVNSTAFYIRCKSKDIATIQWHFEDIGEITASSNMKIWTNMSGSWQGWACNATGDVAEIDISAIKGSEWSPGENLFWKLEILDVGVVSEDLHVVDEHIFYKVTFA
jgi:hypothetical protein